MKISLATLSQATAQQVFDHVVINLLKQNKQSQTVIFNQPDPVCAYRGQAGTKCAGGWVIGDNEYTPEMECHNWPDLVEQFEQIPDAHNQLIREMQVVHDTYDPILWPIYYGRLAGQYGLSIGTMSLFIEQQKQA